MRVRALAFLVSASIMCSGAATAARVKAKVKVAPAKAKAAATAPAKDPLISIFGSASQAFDRNVINDRAAARQPNVVARTGAPATDLTKWLPVNDRARVMLKTKPQREASATLEMLFDEKGRRTSCQVARQTGDLVLLENICDRLSRASRLVPPMARNGRTTEESLELHVRFGPLPVPMVPMISFRENWTGGETPRYVARLFDVTGLPPLKFEVESVPGGARAIGVEVTIQNGKATDCRVGLSFGDAAVDQRACDLARRAAYGAVDAPVSAKLPILFYEYRGDLGALVPRSTAEWNVGASFREADRSRLIGQIKLAGGRPALDGVEIAGLVATDGIMIDCWVTKGTGADKADLALCDQLMGVSYFTPGRDIFGRLRNTYLYRLDLGDKQD